ncbi:hypothetical protein FRB93_009442 [Tulasnella sp. JGI-2019a]|nr:hypothetical protein FRB93_009442 [Tulasnella sp. JGI-2019a]
MTNTFRIVRSSAYAWCIVCAICVLGISAKQASLFVNDAAYRPYIIYTLVCSTLTICGLSLLTLRSQPRLDVIAIAIFTVLWLAVGAYSADLIGYVNCVNLRGQVMETDNGGTYSSMAWCRECKAIMAFSFATFGVLLVCLIILLALIIRLHSLGQQDIWGASMSELPWFGQFREVQGQPYQVYQGQPQPQHQQVPYGSNVIYQQCYHREWKCPTSTNWHSSILDDKHCTAMG